MADAKRHLVYGLHAVGAVIERSPERLLELWMAEPRQDARARSLKDRAQTAGIRVQTVSSDSLAKLAGDVAHQGAVAAVRPLKAWDEHDLLGAISELDAPLLLVLDGVTDPHNLGACLRVADGVGAHAVIVPKDRAVGLNATAAKVASGAAETVPYITVTNLARTLRDLKDRDIWLIGTSDDGEKGLYEADFTGPTALVMGSEGEGMRRLTRETCDMLVSIPMFGSVESLNVSVASGVCLYEARRQRIAKEG